MVEAAGLVRIAVELEPTDGTGDGGASEGAEPSGTRPLGTRACAGPEGPEKVLGPQSRWGRGLALSSPLWPAKPP